MTMETDWPFGSRPFRVRMIFPEDTSPEERAVFFESLAAWERAAKKPFSFGDLRWKNSDGVVITEKDQL